MDMFKLLTRSSNIQPSTPASKKSSIHHIPSNGFLSHLQQETESSDAFSADETAKSRGTKRKRTGVEEKYNNGLLEPLDSFGDGVRPSVSSEKQAKDSENVAHIRKLDVQIGRSTNPVIPDLSKEECWRTLKRHKLKVTILGGASGLQGSHHDQSIRKVSGSLEKNAHAQISPQPLTSFTQLRSKHGISRRLAENLDAQGYTEPSEVQMGSLPLLLGTDEDRGLNPERQERSGTETRADIDLLTVAPTGSGKTLGFMIHVLHGLLRSRQAQSQAKAGERSEHRVQALIIAPTHELADQIVNEGRKLASGTGMKISGLRKGMRLHPHLVSLKDGDALKHEKSHTSGGHNSDFLVKTDIVVSTPLSFLHAISAEEAGPAPLPDIRFLILDEADVLLDPLFREQTLGIWTACTNASLRTSLWSATIGSSIESLARNFILDRRRNLGLTSSTISRHYIVRLVVGLKDSAVPNVAHRLVYAASEQGKLLALRQLLHPSGAPATDAPSLQPPFLVFTQTIPRAIALHSELVYDIPLEAGGSSRIAVLHSDLSDTTRSSIMARFRKGEIWILITTDLLSRGVDFRGLNGVVNYDIPNTGASYVHRVGRTGRQGREGGVAVTLYTKEDVPYVKNVANVIAASERAKTEHAVADNYGEGMQKWLLDALPNVSKKTKKEMKRKGVESRRATAEAAGGRGARKMRISTKSGYDRQLEKKKKGAVDGSRKRLGQVREEEGGVEDEEWGGIDD
ncbi:RNA-dependent ATPase rok1 [Imshaugia aleurites]|uniref:ATP-dependent RNA helicase ROK1 n=1 Tax=Imshaugia aleurites TaxID=172621 RepID=A0A8H3F465_9LECA|nr:RNA-dependent ATPase rok1 [Imshaugia aleurites]